jgi:hypothetical protein
VCVRCRFHRSLLRDEHQRVCLEPMPQRRNLRKLFGKLFVLVSIRLHRTHM